MRDVSFARIAETLSRAYGRISLGTFPTPVRKISLPGKTQTNIWVKCDDLSSPIYGGNKTRKLEFIFGNELRPVLTFGPLGSHHVYSTALHAKAIGRRTAAVLVPQYMTPHHEEIHQEILNICNPVVTLRVHPSAMREGLTVVRMLLRRGKERYHICPPGGTNPLGTLGFVLGGLELASQIGVGELPAPTKLFVPLGTGGTAVGIAIGLAMAGINTEVVAVRVVPRMALPSPALKILMARTLRLVHQAGLEAPPMDRVRMTVVNRFSKHYAVPTPEAANAVSIGEQVGLALETTYSAKAMAALIDTAARTSEPERAYLFWQTFAASAV